MRKDLRALRHGKEKLYGALVTALGALVWLLVLAAAAYMVSTGEIEHLIVPVAEIAAIAVVIGLAKMFYRAWLFGHAVLLGPTQLPRLYDSLLRGSERLGLPTAPQAFVYNSNGLMNAFAMRVLGRRMVMLTSALIDVQSDRQVDFVVGHELGHHVAGHLGFWRNLVKLPGTFVPLLGSAYHRARELTADRIGAYCVDEVEAARGALHMLACGSARLNAAMNADAFSAQEAVVPPVTGFLLHIVSGYPRLTRRVREVEGFYAVHAADASPRLAVVGTADGGRLAPRA